MSQLKINKFGEEDISHITLEEYNIYINNIE